MILSIDIGGTSTRIGVSSDGHEFIKREKTDTPAGFDELISLIDSRVEDKKNIEKIAFGTAGTVDHEKGIIKWIPHRQSWNESNVFGELSKLFPNAIMKIENDANLAALGEAVYGAGRDYSISAWFTLSTGIGGGLVVNKKLVPTKSGFEPGHMIIREKGDIWSCGQVGCFESFASGTAFKMRFGMSGEECRDQTIWDEYAKDLAIGLSNIVVLWSPEVIVLGGGVSNRFDYFVEPLKREIEKIVPFVKIPDIKKSELTEAGLYGGLALFS